MSAGVCKFYHFLLDVVLVGLENRHDHAVTTPLKKQRCLFQTRRFQWQPPPRLQGAEGVTFGKQQEPRREAAQTLPYPHTNARFPPSNTVLSLESQYEELLKSALRLRRSNAHSARAALCGAVLALCGTGAMGSVIPRPVPWHQRLDNRRSPLGASQPKKKL